LNTPHIKYVHDCAKAGAHAFSMLCSGIKGGYTGWQKELGKRMFMKGAIVPDATVSSASYG